MWQLACLSGDGSACVVVGLRVVVGLLLWWWVCLCDGGPVCVVVGLLSAGALTCDCGEPVWVVACLLMTDTDLADPRAVDSWILSATFHISLWPSSFHSWLGAPFFFRVIYLPDNSASPTASPTPRFPSPPGLHFAAASLCDVPHPLAWPTLVLMISTRTIPALIRQYSDP